MRYRFTQRQISIPLITFFIVFTMSSFTQLFLYFCRLIVVKELLSFYIPLSRQQLYFIIFINCDLIEIKQLQRSLEKLYLKSQYLKLNHLLYTSTIMISSIAFFIKLGLYIYLSLTWLQILSNAVDQKDNVRYESTVTKIKGGESSCQEVCEQKYSLVSNDESPWIAYINPTSAKNTTNKQSDEVANYFKQISLEYAKNAHNVTEDGNYKILYLNTGCYFKRQKYFFECFDAQISSSSYRIQRSNLNITLWQKVQYSIKNKALNIFPKEIKNEVIPLLSLFIPSQMIFLSLIVFAGILYILSNKSLWPKVLIVGEEKLDILQYGFRTIDYCKATLKKQIYSPYNRLLSVTNLRIKQALERIENKKIKLITQSCSGIGMSSNIQSWCQKSVYFQGKQVIYYNLQAKIGDIKLSQKTHYQNIESILYAVINQDNRNISNMIQSQFKNLWGFLSSIFRKLSSFPLTILIQFTLATACLEGWLLFVVTIILLVIIGFQHIVFFLNQFRSSWKQFKLKSWNAIIRMLGVTNYVYTNKQVIIINKFDQIMKIGDIEKIKNILKLMQAVQERRSCDVILISQKRVFSEILIEKSKEWRENEMIMAEFQHEIIYPFSFSEMQGLIKERTMSKYLKDAKLLGFFTNNTNDVVKSLKDHKIDQKYIKSQEAKQKFIFNSCLKEVNFYIRQRNEEIRKASNPQEIRKFISKDENKKYLADEKDDEDKKIKKIQGQIKKVMSSITQKIRSYKLNSQEQKKTDKLWKQIKQVFKNSKYDQSITQEILEDVYCAYKYIEVCQGEKQSSQSLKEWIDNEEHTKIFKQKNSTLSAKIATIAYLNYKKILFNGNFINVGYIFDKEFDVKEEELVNLPKKQAKQQIVVWVFVAIALLASFAGYYYKLHKGWFGQEL